MLPSARLQARPSSAVALPVMSGSALAVPLRLMRHQLPAVADWLVATAGTKRIVLVAVPPTALALVMNCLSEPWPDTLVWVTTRALKPTFTPVTAFSPTITRTTCSLPFRLPSASAVSPRRPP